jgi:DNA-binding transcriptional regulator YdaS (Cro superfamily)
MDTWNSRLARALAESDYNANALAAKLGVSAPTVSAWIGSGSIQPARNLTAENAIRVCQLLRIRPEWLLFKEGPMRTPAQANVSEEMQSIIEYLIAIDMIKGPERDDAIYFIKRLLKAENKGSERVRDSA